MRLNFYGAAKTVTGSCYLLEADNLKILIDCGIFQGSEDIVKLNYEDFRFNPKDVNFVLVTHAHMDHIGRIPKLVKEGFSGKIFCTHATLDLCKIMLEDAAEIQASEARDLNIKLEVEETSHQILYDKNDVKKALKKFKKVDYGEKIVLSPKITATFRDAGHILGAAFIEINVNEMGKNKKIIFSGDIGQRDMTIVKDPEYPSDANYVVIESTYGNKLHKDVEHRDEALLEVINKAYKKGGKLLIPSFAVQRTQDLLFRFRRFSISGLFPKEPVFLDSPLAVKATEIFNKHREVFDEEILKHKKPFTFKELNIVSSVQESKKINDMLGPLVIIAGSGMCSSGRIIHHLRHSLNNDKNTLLFVGYQADGTLGKILKEGASEVNILGEDIPVKAEILSIDSFSGHADYKGLIEWLSGMKKKPKKVIIVHGEYESQKAFKSKLESLNYSCYIPELYEQIEL